MSVTTFQYLLSALIQVFGTFIGVYGVFLVLRYQNIKKDIDECKQKIGQYILEGKLNLKIIDDDYRYQNSYSMLLSVYKDYNKDTIIESIKYIKDLLDKKIGHLKEKKDKRTDSILEKDISDKKNIINGLNINELKFIKNIDLINSFNIFVIKALSIPIIITMTLSILLSQIDTIFHYGKTVTNVVLYAVLVITFLGLCSLVKHTNDIFKNQ